MLSCIKEIGGQQSGNELVNRQVEGWVRRGLPVEHLFVVKVTHHLCACVHEWTRVVLGNFFEGQEETVNGRPAFSRMDVLMSSKSMVGTLPSLSRHLPERDAALRVSVRPTLPCVLMS